MRPLKVAALLGAACAVAVVLVFPYLLALLPDLSKVKVGVPLLVAAQAAQGGLLGFALSWVGLRLGQGLGLGAPLLQRTPGARRDFPTVAAAGLAIGAAMVALDRWVFMPSQPAAIREAGAHLARWKGLLASFYGGVGEEVQVRLFVMTLFVWLLARVAGRRPSVYVAGAFLAALVFAAGHLPAAKMLTPLTAPVVVRVMVLNSLGGIVFGIIYWRRGLEHAMVSHFCADLILHVVSS